MKQHLTLNNTVNMQSKQHAAVAETETGLFYWKRIKNDSKDKKITTENLISNEYFKRQ